MRFTLISIPVSLPSIATERDVLARIIKTLLDDTVEQPRRRAGEIELQA